MVNPGKFESIFYQKSKQKINEYKNIKKELSKNNYLEKTSDKHAQLLIKKFRLFEKLTNSKLKFNLTNRIIYSLSLFGLIFILGFQLFFISQSKKNESNITIKPIELEKGF